MEIKQDIGWDEANELLHAVGAVLKEPDRLYDSVQDLRSDRSTTPAHLVAMVMKQIQEGVAGMRILTLLVAVLFMAGCGPNITSGEVCGKEVDPAHDVEIDDSQTVMVGDISITIPASHVEHVPDRFYITFRKMNEEKKRWDERKVEVSKREFEALLPGDFFDMEKSATLP